MLLYFCWTTTTKSTFHRVGEGISWLLALALRGKRVSQLCQTNRKSGCVPDRRKVKWANADSGCAPVITVGHPYPIRSDPIGNIPIGITRSRSDGDRIGGPTMAAAQLWPRTGPSLAVRPKFGRAPAQVWPRRLTSQTGLSVSPGPSSAALYSRGPT